MPIGLLIFVSGRGCIGLAAKAQGWTLHAEVFWIAPQIGMALIAVGLMLAFNSIQTL